MKKQIDLYCGFGSRSEKLPGALSPNMEFLYFSKTEDEFGIDEKTSFKSIIQYINEDYDLDYINEIITCDEGAVLDAYNLDGLDNIDFLKTYLLIHNKELYPDYNLKIVEKEFPLDIISGEREEPKEVINSTHIVCITNYKEQLNKEKTQKI